MYLHSINNIHNIDLINYIFRFLIGSMEGLTKYTLIT